MNSGASISDKVYWIIVADESSTTVYTQGTMVLVVISR